jgi:hypothetical protein
VGAKTGRALYRTPPPRARLIFFLYYQELVVFHVLKWETVSFAVENWCMWGVFGVWDEFCSGKLGGG